MLAVRKGGSAALVVSVGGRARGQCRRRRWETALRRRWWPGCAGARGRGGVSALVNRQAKALAVGLGTCAGSWRACRRFGRVALRQW